MVLPVRWQRRTTLKRGNASVFKLLILTILLGAICLSGLQVSASSDPAVPPASPEELVPLDGQTQLESAPAQQWQYKVGMLAASGNLSSGGAGGSLSMAHETPSWLWDLRADSGLLNGGFGATLSAAGGWSPNGAYGAFVKLSGEFSSAEWEHFQALLNLGWRPADKLSLLMTLDYLQKRTEVSSWDKTEYISQYGVGLESAYQITSSISLSGLFMHYKTMGKEYGKVGDYEYTDEDNWYHYGYIYGAVRGGQYNELGVEAQYAHPSGWFSFSLGLSQIWRTYEEMLGHAEKNNDTGAGSASLTLPNLMGSGLNFNAAYRQEFASDNGQSWQVGAYRMFGPVSLGLYYQELSNDLIATDRRLYASVTLPLGQAAKDDKQNESTGRGQALAGKKTQEALADPNLVRQMAGLNPGDDGRKENSKAAWLRNPVKGMGTPNLRVAEQVERRVDQTHVGMDGMPEDSSVEGNVLTIGGFPALSSYVQDACQPETAAEAFSIGEGGTSVKVVLSKLPAPADIWASFKQSDGNYSVLYLSTEKGSIVTKIGEKVYDLPNWIWKTGWDFPRYSDIELAKRIAVVEAIKNQRPTGYIVGASKVYVGDTEGYYVDVNYPSALMEFWRECLPVDRNGWENPWKISFTSDGYGSKISKTFTKAGWHKVTAEVRFNSIYSTIKVVKWVEAVEKPKDGNDSGGGAPAPTACNVDGTGWTFTGTGGLNYVIGINASGQVMYISGATPYADPTLGGITTNTTALGGNRINGTVESADGGGSTYRFIFNLNCNGNSMTGTIESEGIVPADGPTVHTVTGAHP
jgi:hypothetical protein